MTLIELKARAKELKIKNWWLMKKADLELAVIPASRIVAAEVTLADIHETAPEDADGKKLNQVPVSPQGEHESVEDFIARGGKITVIPTLEFPAPKPPRESSAMKANPDMPKKTPRKISKPAVVIEETKPAKKPIKRPANKGTQVKEEAPVKTLSQRKITKERRVPVVKSVSGDIVTLASLTEGRDIEGRILRRMLRNSEIAKPGAQWEWPKGHADIAKVEAIINKRWI